MLNSQVFTFVTGWSLQTSFFELYKDLHVHNASPILAPHHPVAHRSTGIRLMLSALATVGNRVELRRGQR